MFSVGDHHARLAAVEPRHVGVLTILAGIAALCIYPLAVVGVVPGGRPIDPGMPRLVHPLVVYASVVPGAILVIWGASVVHHRSITSLTPQRALLALVPATLSAVVGVGIFVVGWTGRRLVDHFGRASRPLSVADTLGLGLTVAQFVGLTLVAALFVGSVAARHEWRRTLASAALPVVLLGLGVLWLGRVPSVGALAILVVVAAIPFTVGYALTTA